MASPSIDNYTIGKGNVYTSSDGVTWTHRGNCKEFTFEISYDDDKEHISSMEGVGRVDLTIPGKQKATLSLVLDEMSTDNMKLALAGDTGTGGQDFDIGVNSGSTLWVKLTQTGDYGPTREFIFPSVLLRLDGAMSFIGEDFVEMTISGSVNYTSNRFGYWNDLVVSG